MEKADIEREKLLMMPVRELITIESVREQRLAGNERIYIIRGYLGDNTMAYRNLRTADVFKAALCRVSIGRPAVWVKWQRNPFNKFAWNEHDILDVEVQ
jgi:hypothetical protein